MKKRNLTLIAVAAAMAFGSSHVPANSVVVDQSESGKHNFSLTGTANSVSKYRGLNGDRVAAKLVWSSPWDAPGSGFLPHKYELQRVNPENLASQGVLNLNGFQGDLEKNVPFKNTSNKIVGLYVPEWAYWDRAYTADLVPARNVTHVFYSFLGICDFDNTTIEAVNPENGKISIATPNPDPNRVPGTGNATNNSGLAIEGNKRGQLLLAAMCGRNGFPKYEGGIEPIMSGGDTPATLKSDFEVTKYDPVASHKMLDSMREMKSVNPNLKVMVSVGGWTLSSPFHGMTAQKEAREIFVNSIIGFLKANPFVDGIDLDWEFPGGGGPDGDLGGAGNAAKRTNYTALVKELRSALDRNFTGGQRKQLSAAVTASPAKLTAIDFTALKDDFDFVNVMTYDLYGAFTRYPSHHAALHAKPVAAPYGAPGANDLMTDKSGAPIVIGGKEVRQADVLRNYSAEGAIEHILKNTQFPASKLVMGAASYSRGWHTVRVKSEHDKLFWHGVADGSEISRKGLGVNGTFEHGVTDYRELHDKYVKSGANLYYDKQAEAAYIWTPKGSQNGFKLGTVDSFDSQRSVIAKAQFVKDKKLGGMFAWDASTDNGLIVNAMNAGLCNQLNGGGYYNFTENYAGVVTTEVVESANGVATKVRENMSAPQSYRFDGQAFCQRDDGGSGGGNEGGQDPIPAPVANAGADRTVVATGNWGYRYTIDGSKSTGENLSYQWRLISGSQNNDFRLEKADRAKADAIVSKGTVGTGVYELTVTDTKTGKTAKATTRVIAVAPKATISGSSSIASGTSVKFTANANFSGGTTTYQWTIRNAAGNAVDSGQGRSWTAGSQLAAGDYTVEVKVHSTAGERRASATHKLKVTDAQQPDQDDNFFETLRLLSNEGTDIGNKVGFQLSALPGQGVKPPSKQPTYEWSYPKFAEDVKPMGDGAALTFNVSKTDKVQSFPVSVVVKLGDRSKTLSVQLTVKAASGDDGGNGGNGGNGGKYPAYKEGTPYKAGDIVAARDGKNYQCKPWPFTGWCGGAAWAYEPGKGIHWNQAWDLHSK